MVYTRLKLTITATGTAIYAYGILSTLASQCADLYMFIDDFYNPVANEKQERVRLQADRLNHWIAQGAQVSDAVAKLIKEQKAAA